MHHKAMRQRQINRNAKRVAVAQIVAVTVVVGRIVARGALIIINKTASKTSRQIISKLVLISQLRQRRVIAPLVNRNKVLPIMRLLVMWHPQLKQKIRRPRLSHKNRILVVISLRISLKKIRLEIIIQKKIMQLKTALVRVSPMKINRARINQVKINQVKIDPVGRAINRRRQNQIRLQPQNRQS